VLLVGALMVAGVDVPAFSAVDLVFLSGYAALVTGLVQLAKSSTHGPGWVITLLDTGVGAIALATFAWVGIGHDLVDAMAGADIWSRVIAPLYPILDIAVVVGLTAMAIRRTAFRLDPRLVALAVGLGVQVIADLSYLADGVGRTFAEASPRFDLYLFSSACYVMVGILAGWERSAREFPERTVSAWALVWPYALGIGLIVLHVVDLVRLEAPMDDIITLIGSIGVGVLVLLRQGIAIRQVRDTVERQRRELISSVSHEVRTPLTGLLGYLQLLTTGRDAFSPEEVDEMLEIASCEAGRLSVIITDMVAMARDDSAGLAVNTAPTPLDDVCRTAVERAGIPDVTVSVAIDQHIPADRDRLCQAIVNLLSNAEKYGRGEILLEVAQESGDVRIEVHDNGPGVPLRYQERIWEKFERGSHRLDATTPGMGFGLSIVRAIAVAHGGSAGYRRSEKLGGACFVITLPAKQAAGHPGRVALPAAAAGRVQAL
jgi:signal transduction histidine kinase